MHRLRTLSCFAAALLACAGCRRASTPAAAPRSYPIRGTIVSTDPRGAILLNHQAIPGFMEAMTMSYKLAAPDTVSELHPGDHIAARLLLDEDAAGPGNLRLDRVVITAQARPGAPPPVQYHVPAAGDAVPDFTFRNQSNRNIHLGAFRGKVLALTFIYTRCPLADFCPRMSHNFAAVDKALGTDPALRSATHLLSLSFDPAYDTPAVLRSYGGSYTGRFTGETFDHWDFAAPSPAAQLPAIEQFFGVGVTPGTAGTFNHSVSTVVIGRDGRIEAFFPTNDWSPQDLLNAMRTAAAKP